MNKYKFINYLWVSCFIILVFTCIFIIPIGESEIVYWNLFIALIMSPCFVKGFVRLKKICFNIIKIVCLLTIFLGESSSWGMMLVFSYIFHKISKYYKNKETLERNSKNEI